MNNLYINNFSARSYNMIITILFMVYFIMSGHNTAFGASFGPTITEIDETIFSKNITNINSIIIYAPDLPPKDREMVESIISERLNKDGIISITSYSILISSKTYSQDQERSALLSSGVDATLQLKTLKAGTYRKKSTVEIKEGRTQLYIGSNGQIHTRKQKDTIIEEDYPELSEGQYIVTFMDNHRELEKIWEGVATGRAHNKFVDSFEVAGSVLWDSINRIKAAGLISN